MERDLSARFIDMDEHYFTPTMAKYQHEQDMQRTRSESSYEADVAKTKTTITGFKPVSSLPRHLCSFHLIKSLPTSPTFSREAYLLLRLYLATKARNRTKTQLLDLWQMNTQIHVKLFNSGRDKQA